MPFPLRPILLLALAALAPCTALRADEADADAGDADLGDLDVAALLEEAGISPWQFSGTARAAFGYRDNVLYSRDFQEGSSFLRYGGDALVWRLPEGAFEGHAFASFERTDYLDNPGADAEQSGFLQARVQRVSPGGYVRLEGLVLYQDLVLDASPDSSTLVLSPVKVWTFRSTATWRQRLAGPFFLEAAAQLQHANYLDLAEDNDEWNTAASAGIQLGPRSELTLGWHHADRAYDDRFQATAGGRSIISEDTRLRLLQNEGRLRADVRWDVAGRWRTVTRLAYLENRDNGTGWYDYDRWRLQQSVIWAPDPWRLTLEGEHQVSTYGVQLGGIGFDPPPLERVDRQAAIEIARELSEHVTLALEARWEESDANDEAGGYEVFTTALGLEVAW